ncbi:MAG: McrC family protein [Gorillibacterium sp.]|nr:McrC family protein [Gorillibacterium sp.]
MSLPGHFFDMNRFFETLVSKLLKTLSQKYKEVDQYRLNHLFAYDSAHNPQRRQSPTPRPDFAILKKGQPQQLLDAKYRDLWDKSLPRDMLYQLAMYALSGVGNSATILYPVLHDLSEPQHIQVHNPLSGGLKARIYLKPINLIKVAGWIQEKNMSSLASYMEEVIAW